MAKARKLKSGNWNIQILDYVDEDGKKHVASFTAPTKAEVEYMAAKHKKERPAKDKRQKQDMTVEEAIRKYIDRSQVLSPTTLHGYERMLKYGFQPLMKRKVKDLDSDAMQKAINDECCRTSEKVPGKPISTKTVINEWGLLSSALRSICDVAYNVRLPKKQQHIKELPDPQTVLDAIIGSSIELPCLLALWLSFSMSEIRGLMCSSVRDDYITIDRVMVDAGSSIMKSTAKTETRLRMHKLPPYILRLISQSEEYQRYLKTGNDELLIPLTHDQIYKRWLRICQKNGFTMTFHDLRHMSASIMLALGVPDKYAMERGGWATPHIMKSIYQHTLSAERQRVDSIVDSYFEEMLDNNSAQTFCTKPENH